MSQDDIISLLKAILKELVDAKDEGQYLRRNGTANTITFDIINTDLLVSHAVKGYIIKNDGVNTLQVAQDLSPDITDSNIDINTTITRFYNLFPSEEFRVMYNRKTIRNLFIRAVGGNSAYRLWLLW